jgi:hypothetical protein
MAAFFPVFFLSIAIGKNQNGRKIMTEEKKEAHDIIYRHQNLNPNKCGQQTVTTIPSQNA